MTGLLLEIYAWCALAMLWLLAALRRHERLFACELSPVEALAFAAMWPIALLWLAAEWAISRRGHR